jgi:hypothetical protein
MENRKIKISSDARGHHAELTMYKNIESKIQTIKGCFPSILGNITLTDIAKHHHVEDLLKSHAEREIQLPIAIDEKLRLIFPMYKQVFSIVDDVCNEVATNRIRTDYFDDSGLLIDSALNEIETSHTCYAESETQLKAYDLANEIVCKIEELNKLFAANNKPLFYEYSQLHPMYINRIGKFDINLNALLSSL